MNHPTIIAQDALANWNAYTAYGNHEHRQRFLAQADWLLEHAVLLSNGVATWPMSIHIRGIAQPCLSALVQGNAISVLIGAYRLTGNDGFLQTAQQAVRAFALDILDGGVSASIGDDGMFFEEVAVYPAAHVLSTHILALLGLYDYLALTHDSKVEGLIQRGINALHMLLDAFDTGYWTRYDLLHRSLASQFTHSLHVALLQALASTSNCEHCAALAARWATYQHHPGCRLRYLVSRGTRTLCERVLKTGLQRSFFDRPAESSQTLARRVCIPITAFPIAGGMRSVLAGVAQTMCKQWEPVYLTYHKGQEAQGLQIETFGRQKITAPWQFPFVWLYCLAGGIKLFGLLRHNPGYDLILPQDGIFTGAFAGLVSKMAGVRVVCMDHGNMTLLDNPAYRKEIIQHMQADAWYRRIVARLRLALYYPSLHLLARIATCCADQFLIAGDEVEAVYRERFEVHPGRIVRYAYMLDADRFTPPDKEYRAKMRAEQGIAEDARVIVLINRLAPEKGLEIAITAIGQALAALSTDIRARVRVIIAGDGPLRFQLQANIRQHGLDAICTLWGEASPSDVVTLLAISDIFLYCGTRGTNYSMAVLEAMAAGCAVIASTRPLSNAKLLAGGRGIAVPTEDIKQTCDALVRLLNDPELCRQMGRLARDYVVTEHNAAKMKCALLRATYWASLNEFLQLERIERA
ncbi:MAG TPA: D-glucuronyl C5-epimerase family protein [Ktedonobacteraceae bacterium]|nr:D-glucuronyl C5-epimerase family protein [Ktedonobacteraceae bacterium]